MKRPPEEAAGIHLVFRRVLSPPWQ